MKKILLFLFVLLLCHSSYAAFQYHQKGSNGYFSFDSETSVEMKTSIYHNFLTYPSIAPVVDFGYYFLGGNTLYSNDLGFLGQFTTGDRIGIWIKASDGKTYASTGGVSGTFHGTVGQSGGEYCLYRPDVLSFGTPSHYEYQLLEAEAPAGQPLPGILATLIAGGGLLFGMYRKRGMHRS